MEPSWPFFLEKSWPLVKLMFLLSFAEQLESVCSQRKREAMIKSTLLQKTNNGQSIALLNGRSGKKRQLVFQTWKRQVMVQRKFGNLFKWIFRIVEPTIGIFCFGALKHKKHHTDKRNCHHLPFSSPPIRTKSTFATWSLSS